MKSLFAVITSTLLLLGIGACAGLDQKQPPGDIRQKIADAYGIQSFDRIAKIRFEFNADLDGKQINRKWLWAPNTDQVIYRGLSSQLNPTAYNRKKITSNDSGRIRRIDKWFVNDQYWLLFPFHMAWDSETEVVTKGRQFLPIGLGRALQVVVTYPPEGGYTPGDVYELFVDGDYRLKQWKYRRGGKAEAARISTWEDHRKVGPITVSMQRKLKGGKSRIWFSHVAVQLEGSEEWIVAE